MADNDRNVRLDRLKDSAEVWIGNLDPSVHTGAMIETAFLMAAADGNLSGIEYDQLVATIEFITSQKYDRDRIESMIDQLLDSLQADGWDARIAAIAASLPDPELRRNAYRLAAGVSFIDGEVQESEARLFGILAHAFEIPDTEATWLLTDVRDELFGDEAEGGKA